MKNQPHTTTLRQRRMAFAESCHYAHCTSMSPPRQRRMRTILNKFDWGIGWRWKWMMNLWGMA